MDFILFGHLLIVSSLITKTPSNQTYSKLATNLMITKMIEEYYSILIFKLAYNSI